MEQIRKNCAVVSNTWRALTWWGTCRGATPRPPRSGGLATPPGPPPTSPRPTRGRGRGRGPPPPATMPTPRWPRSWWRSYRSANIKEDQHLNRCGGNIYMWCCFYIQSWIQSKAKQSRPDLSTDWKCFQIFIELLKYGLYWVVTAGLAVLQLSNSISTTSILQNLRLYCSQV